VFANEKPFQPNSNGFALKLLKFSRRLFSKNFQNVQTVHASAVYGQSPVQVRPGNSPSGAHFSQDFSGLDDVTLMRVNLR
jgi:hypothetical protein